MWTLFEHILRDGHRRKDIGPADIEGQLRDGLRCRRLRQPVIQRPGEVGRSCAVCPLATSALTVTRLPSLGARSGRSHRSRNSTSVVYFTTPGKNAPNCASTLVARFDSAASSTGSGI